MDFRFVVLVFCLYERCFISAKEPRCFEFNFLESLLEKLVGLENKIEMQEKVNAQEKTQLQSRVADLEEKQLAMLLEKENSPSVAFTAYLDESLTLSPGDVVKFDKLLLNQGDLYSSTTGEFTVPYDGLYFFTWHIQAIKQLTTCLSINGVCLVHAYTPGLSPEDNIIGDSNSATLRLTTGDKVRIELQFGSELYSNSNKKWYYPVFTGYSLR